jgi:hypothetical protein
MYKKKTISSLSNYSFVLPETFNASHYLKGPLAKRTDDANYLVSTIYRRQAMGAGHGEHDYVMLHAATLNKVMAKDDATKVKEALISAQVIDCDMQYAVGEHSRGYRLNKQFRRDKCIRIKSSNVRLIRALEREDRRRKKGELYDHFDPKTRELCQKLEAQFHRIEIDIVLAKKLISDLPKDSNPFDQQSVIVHDLYEKCFQVFPTQWGRLYNSISSLHSLVREALSFNGKRLVSVDVKNSQPALLGLKAFRYQSQSHPQEIPNDLEQFMQEVREGRFYESLLAECIAKGQTAPTKKYSRTRRTMERQDVKDDFMIHVLAKRGRYPSPFREVFANRYPTVDSYIRRTNRESHKTLIRELQREEADFVIHNVAAGALLLPSNPLALTLHDCIICGEGQAELIEGEFERGFNEIGYRMRVSVDPF